MIKICKTFLISILLLLSPCVFTYERFVSWDDDITVNTDGSVTVDERITIKTECIAFKRGMWRTFPTRYTGWLGLQYVVGFDVERVERNGIPEPFRIVDRINGKQIYIGDQYERLRPGQHTYRIVYKTTRQLGFFQDYDELYFNVIGNDVGFEVDRVTARVHLPPAIPQDKIHFEGYTGIKGHKERNFQAKSLDDGTVLFESTQKLWPYHAFTIVVTWPKGYVNAPSSFTTFWYYLRDNIALLLLLLGLLSTIFFLLWAFRKTREGKKEQPIIPLFHPPGNINPGSLRYLLKKGYDVRSLTADIVDMAVKGMVEIEYIPGMFYGGTYRLKAKPLKDKTEFDDYYLLLYSLLFREKDSIELTQKNLQILQTLKKGAQIEYQFSMDKFIEYNHGYIMSAGLMALAFLGGALLFSHTFLEAVFPWIIVYVLANVGLLFYYFRMLPTYTNEGQKLHDQVEGFKLFLQTTEPDRLKVIGTPPTKTPQLWETYLPYAIALGVEKQWSQQFAPVFAQLEQEGRPYTPMWYIGPGRFSGAAAPVFASNMGNSLNSAITAASTPPGSRSGSGGRGGAGGGGGGGGAGGW